MTHKVIVPPKKIMSRSFLKQRDIGNFYVSECCCLLLLLCVVVCCWVLLCVVGRYRGLLVAVCEQVLRGGWLVARAPPPPHHYSLGIHGCMLVGGYYSYIRSDPSLAVS